MTHVLQAPRRCRQLLLLTVFAGTFILNMSAAALIPTSAPAFGNEIHNNFDYSNAELHNPAIKLPNRRPEIRLVCNEEEIVRLIYEESARREDEEQKLEQERVMAVMRMFMSTKHNVERINEEKRLAKEAEAAQISPVLTNLRAGYLDRIRTSIESHLVTPPEARNKDGLEVVIEVNLEADGTLVGLPEIVESSGIPEYDEAAERAVIKAAPLPMPKHYDLQEEFRQLRLHITPQ